MPDNDFKDIDYAALVAQEFDASTLAFADLCSEQVKTLYSALIGPDVQLAFAEKLRARAKELNRKGDFEKWWRTVTKVQRPISTKPNMSDLPLALDFGPYGITDAGLYTWNEREGDVFFAEGTPLIVTRILHNIDNEPVKIEITYKLRGVWHSLIVNRRDVADNKSILCLSDREINVNSTNAALLVQYIARLIAINENKIPVERSVGRLGWHGDEFVPYGVNYVFDGSTADGMLYSAVSAKGDAGKWMEIYRLARTNPIVRFYLAASLTSPLVALLDGQIFLTHIWGNTETGKTVASMLAASVWGDPARLVFTFNATKVWAERRAAFLCNVPFILNELQTIKDKYQNTDQLIYQLCEGQSKGRGTKTGGTEDMRFWRLTILSNGEQPMTDESTLGGAANRVIDLHTEGPLFTDPVGICDVIHENYGHAGEKFVEAVKELQTEKLAEAYKIYRRHITGADIMDKQINALSFIALADFLAACILEGADTDTATDSTFNFIDKIIAILPKKRDVDLFERAYDSFVSWIRQNTSKFTDSEFNKENYGIIETEKEKGKNVEYCYILPTAFETWCKDVGYNKKMIVACFIENCILTPNTANRNRIGKRIKNEGTWQCYKIKMA
jgi:Superfamily II helicase and inactivated derivatives